MTKQEILTAFQQAEKDWKRPFSNYDNFDTAFGLCNYFAINQRYSQDNIEKYLRPLWKKYATKASFMYDFYLSGTLPQGREERLTAIRMVIDDLTYNNK
jgi:hypothetical protein